MKKYRFAAWATAGLGLLAANTGRPQTAEKPAPTDDEVLVMSPFEVAASAESGYVATSSMAGSRVNTDLKDIASQIDVMTPEFLTDINADSIADAVIFSSNFGAPNDQNISGSDGITSVNTEGRARGQDAATVSTDFFATNLPIDFYNIDRLNLAYGAQSILFGLGGAGGVLDSSTKRATMRDRVDFDVKFDSWGSSRETLDINHVLLPDKLAFRLVGLNANARQFTDGGHTDSSRGFGTLTFKPFSKTTVRVSYEDVNIQAQRATNYLSYDFVSPWVAAGRPLFNNAKGAPASAVTASDPLYNRNTNNIRVMTYGAGGDSYVAWNNTVATKGPHELPGVIDQDTMSLVDGSIYPTSVDPRVSARINDIRGNQFRMWVEQRVTSDLYFEFAFNHEERREQAGGTFDTNDSLNIRGDANQYMPGGTTAAPQTVLNPNAGGLYIESVPHGTTYYNLTQEARFTGFYEFDARKHLSDRMAWLGRHRITTLLSTRRDRTESQEDRAVLIGNSSFTTGDAMNNSRLLRVRYYLQTPDEPNPTRATTYPGTGYFGPWTLTDPANGSPLTYVMFDNPNGSFFSPIGNKVEVDTAMAALQSFFAGDRLNVFAGLRQDHIKSYSFDAASGTRQDLALSGDQQGLYVDLADTRYNSTPDAVKTSVMGTYGVVLRPLRWLSLFYNTSENTSLPPGRYGPFGNALEGTSADGYDYGVRFDLLNNKLSIRLNFFEDNQKDLWSNPFNQLRNYSANIEQRLRGSDRPAGIADVPASTFDPIANPIDLYRSLSDKTATGLDLVLVANPTDNWTIRATVGRQKNILKKRGQEWIEWIQQRLPVWQDAGGLGWENVTLTSSSSQTIEEYYNETILPQIVSQQTVLGQFRFREREWRANLFTSYHFTGKLKGLTTGGGVRWVDSAVTGNGGIDVGLAAPVDDPNVTYRHSEPQTFVDVLLGYRRKLELGGQRRTVNFQLNVRNLFDYDTWEVARTNHDGVDFQFIRTPPRQFVFSAGLEF